MPPLGELPLAEQPSRCDHCGGYAPCVYLVDLPRRQATPTHAGHRGGWGWSVEGWCARCWRQMRFLHHVGTDV